MKFRLSLLPLLPFFLLTLLLALGACKKDNPSPDTTDYAARDEALITDYIRANGLTGFREVDTTGVYLAITRPGTGPLAKEGQTLTARYSGSLLNGATFDQNNSALGFSFVLDSDNPSTRVIEGWNIAFRQLNEGSKATLLIPSGQAYGGAGRRGIPPHSVLRFDVELLRIR